MLVEKAFLSLAHLAALVLGSIDDGTPSDSRYTVGTNLENGDQAPLLVDFKNSPLGEKTLLACIKAPNCEIYESDRGSMIRFVAGEEPGSANYRRRFGTNASMKAPTSEEAPSVNEGSHSAFDGDIHTNVDIGETALVYGSTRPYDAIHFAYDPCGISTCDPTSFSVDTSSVRSTGSDDNTVVTGYTLSVSVTGEYDGYAGREVFIQAVLAASGQGQQATNQHWRYRDSNGDVETGSLVVYSQTGFFGVNRFDGNHVLQGFMWVEVKQYSTTSNNWCSIDAGILSGVIGAIDPVGGGFFGVVAAECAAHWL